jgi:uncharacterized membrane protein
VDLEKKYFKHSIVMVVLFLVGGFSLMYYVFQAYSFFWGSGNLGLERNITFNSTLLRNVTIEQRPRPTSESFLTSPQAIISLVNGIVSIAGAVALWALVNEKEITKVKENISTLLMSPEEKSVVEELKKADGELNQNQLVRNTGFSKVKVHRALVRLEMRKIVKKYPYGLTNKIVLEKTSI